MKILTLFNQYRSLFNGEETVVQSTLELLRQHGDEAELWQRSSRGVTTTWDKASAFVSGVYSLSARREMSARLRSSRPDIVHAHNLFPLFSPSVLAACRSQGVPVVMSLHNQNLTCPKSDHMRRGLPCEKCLGGREYQCVLHNCRDNILESLAYALRSGVARQLGLFRRNVTRFIALSQFARQRLVEAGFPPEQVVVLPNMVEIAGPPPSSSTPGGYAGFAGRLSPEKGVDTLLRAAQLSGVPLRIAGDGPQAADLKSLGADTAEFVGRLARDQMNDFYRGARFLVLSSNAFEMCPLVISEAMSCGTPVIASRIGGVDEMVEDGVTGLLFEPGDAQDLADKMRRLWDNQELCAKLGRAGYEKAQREYSVQAYTIRLLSIYHEAIDFQDASQRDSAPRRSAKLREAPTLNARESTSPQPWGPGVHP